MQSKSQTFLLQTQAIIDEWLHIWKWAKDLVSNQTFHLASKPGFLSGLEPRPFVWLQTWTCPLYGSEPRLSSAWSQTQTSECEHELLWQFVGLTQSPWPPYRQVTAQEETDVLAPSLQALYYQSLPLNRETSCLLQLYMHFLVKTVFQQFRNVPMLPTYYQETFWLTDCFGCPHAGQ